MRFLHICTYLVLFTTSLFSQPVIPPPPQTDEIIIDAAPTGSAEPGDRIRYKVQIQNTGSAAATLVQLNAVLDPRTTLVPGSFKTSPLAFNDAYPVTGNVGINIPLASGLKANDFDDNIAGLTITAGTFATTQGGSIMISADGSFMYTPPAGFTGTDTYIYTLNDGNGVGGGVPATDMGTVTFTVSNLIWFIDNSAGVGDGRLTTPFNSLTAFNAGSAAAGDVVYMEHTGTNYTGGIVLQNSERLYGEGHTGGANLSNVLPFILAPNSKTLPNINGTRPVVTNAAGNGVTLAQNNTLRGFDVGSSSAFAIDDNGTVGTLTVSELVINNTTGAGFRADNGGTLAVTLGSLTSSGGLDGIYLNNTGGTFTVTGATTISNSTNQGLRISNSSTTASFAAITVGNTASTFQSIFLELNTGTFNASGLTTVNAPASGGGASISLSGGTAAITFTGLDINGRRDKGLFISTGSGNLNTGNINIDNTNASTATALDISTSSGRTITFGDTDIDNGGANGIAVNIQNNTGTISFAAGSSITGAAMEAFKVHQGNANITYNGTINNTAGPMIRVTGRTAGTIDFQGNLTHNAAGVGITVGTVTAGENNTGGTVLFSGASKSITSSTSNAVSIVNNTGAFVNFTNGGLVISTTSGNGYAATGGGTVTIQGSGNTVSSGAGAAVNVSNTTIASTGITFLSVTSTNSTAVGITLNTTGNSGGGFTITGTGTTPGSGGTISQNSAGATNGSTTAGIGIYLNSTNNISLSNMNFTGTFGNYGIRGFTVNNFSLLESNFTGVYGTALTESTIHFGTQGADGTGNGLTGTAVFTGNSIGGGFSDNVGVFNNNTGSLNISFADGAHPAIINHNSTTNGNDGIFVESRGNGGAIGAGFNLTFSAIGVEFKGARGDNLQVAASSNATNNVTILNNTFHNTHPQIVSGGGGLAVVGAGTNMTVNYNIEGNSFRGAKSSPIHIAYGGFSGNARGTVLNNIIGVDDPGRPPAKIVQDSTGASDNGNGINMYNDKGLNAGILTHATRIQGNQIRDITGIPIYIRSNAPGTGLTTVEATVLNNVVEEVRGVAGLGGTFSCLYGIVGGGGFPDPGRLGFNIRNNTFHQDNTSGIDGDHNAITFDQATLESEIYLPGYTGGASDHMAVSNFLTNAPYSNTMSNGQVDLSGVGAKVYVNAILDDDPFVLLPVPLYAAYSPTTINFTNSLTKEEVNHLLNAALKRFEKSGTSQEEMEKLKRVTVTISDMPVLFLGLSDSLTITIDTDAAGFGWFVDETPDDDAEFMDSDPSCVYAESKMDLLSVLMHELGHHIGLRDDIDPACKHATLMEGILRPGERHLPEEDH